MSEETPGVVSHRLLENFGPDENFPTLEEIDQAEPEFWRRIKEHGRADSRGGCGTPEAEPNAAFRGGAD